MIVDSPAAARRASSVSLWRSVMAALLATVLPALAPADDVRVVTPVAFGQTPPLATMTPTVPPPAALTITPRRPPDTINGRWRGPSPQALPAASVLQNWPGSLAMPAPLLNFEGNGTGLPGFIVTYAPADAEGDVGPQHYFQWVNTMFTIWDKAGNKLYGPAQGNSIFAGLAPNRCASDPSLEPLVHYDAAADRWFVSSAAFISPPFYQCVAVSKTNDPVNGGWYAWAFTYPDAFNDFAKSGVWPDAYYMTTNLFKGSTSTYLGAQVCAFDRVAMLAGDPTASEQCFGPNPNYGSLLPSELNLGGTLPPPAGAPNYVMSLGASGQLLLWPFHVDWANPANSTFPFDSPTTIPVAAFRNACNDTGGVCVPQLGTTQRLDSVGERLMWRLNYRNFGTHESLVLNHSVDVGVNGPTAIRWYEVRSPGAAPFAYQQGTYAPDAASRWMGGINMDVEGDIALGYSISSATMNPSIRYAGRLWSDSLGALPQAEGTLQAGTGSQTPPLNRWGEYSTMSVDPTDGCTFWYTQEYLAANGSWNWRTRIGSFSFPGCSNVCPGITGQVGGAAAICPGSSAEVTVTVSGGRPPYLVRLDNGGGSRLGSGPAFTFTVSPATTTTYAVEYLSDDKGCLGSGNGSATIVVNALPQVTAPPADGFVCPGETAVFTVAASGTAITYRWQADAGAGFVDLVDGARYSGTTTPSLTVPAADAALNSVRYRAVVTGACPPAAISAAATLTVKAVAATPGALAGATAGTSYMAALSGTGGSGPYTFAATSLPSWLTLAADGSLSGTPTVAGGADFSVVATDAAGCPGSAQAYSIVVSPGPPAELVSPAGTPQSALLNRPFGRPLGITVHDAYGNPIPGVSITFSAPVSGASATFPAGGMAVEAVTGADGAAISPTLTANGVPGRYQVSATVELAGGGTLSAAFDLTNTEPIPALASAGAAALTILLLLTGVLALGVWKRGA